MSLIQTVARMVAERGRATARDIEIPGRNFDQIVKALQNAKQVGLVRSVGYENAGRRGGCRAVYEAVESPPPDTRKRPRKSTGVRCKSTVKAETPRGELWRFAGASSIFDYAQRAAG